MVVCVESRNWKPKSESYISNPVWRWDHVDWNERSGALDRSLWGDVMLLCSGSALTEKLLVFTCRSYFMWVTFLHWLFWKIEILKRTLRFTCLTTILGMYFFSSLFSRNMCEPFCFLFFSLDVLSEACPIQPKRFHNYRFKYYCTNITEELRQIQNFCTSTWKVPR